MLKHNLGFQLNSLPFSFLLAFQGLQARSWAKSSKPPSTKAIAKRLRLHGASGMPEKMISLRKRTLVHTLADAKLADAVCQRAGAAATCSLLVSLYL